MRRKAFTLIELLIVIAIIGILAGLIIATTGVARPAARDSKRVANLKELSTALEMYHNQNEKYPAAPSGNHASDIIGLASDFIPTIPIDPKNDSTVGYVYTYFVNDSNNPTKYVLRAKLEQSGAKSLDEDLDGDNVHGANCKDADRYYCIGIP